MEQLIATEHNQPLNVVGYFQSANLQLEMAFFIFSRNSLTRFLLVILEKCQNVRPDT